MRDKNFKEVNVGDTIYFRCGAWAFEAKVYKVTENRIYYYQTSEGNGEGVRSDSNMIECERYCEVITTKRPDGSGEKV